MLLYAPRHLKIQPKAVQDQRKARTNRRRKKAKGECPHAHLDWRCWIAGAGVPPSFITLLRMKREGTVNRIVACDTAPANLPSTTGIDAMYAEWGHMCDSESLDLVILATPNRTHEAIGLALLGRGVRTLIEKPFSTVPSQGPSDLSSRQRKTTHTLFLVTCYGIMPAFSVCANCFATKHLVK